MNGQDKTPLLSRSELHLRKHVIFPVSALFRKTHENHTQFSRTQNTAALFNRPRIPAER